MRLNTKGMDARRSALGNGHSIPKRCNAADALLCSNPPGRPCIARMALLLAARLDRQTSRFPSSHVRNAWPAHIRFLLK